MKSNKGMTLLEVMAAMAILSLVMGMVLSFIFVSANHYKAAETEVNIQYETQAAANQIQDIIINAGAGICYQVDGSMVAKDSECSDGGASAVTKEVCVYRIEEETKSDGTIQNRLTLEKVIWNKNDEKLYYSKYYVRKKADGTFEHQQVEANCLLAEYAVFFSADLSQGEDKRQVNISLIFQKGDKRFSVEKEIALRNPAKINVSESQLGL